MVKQEFKIILTSSKWQVRICVGICLLATSIVLFGRSRTEIGLKGSLSPSPKVYANPSVRRVASGIHRTDVKCLYLYGVHMGCFAEGSSPPIVVTDSAIIQLFIDALRHATSTANVGIGNGVDTLQFHFNIKDGKRREQESFSFNPQHTGIWYGPKFKNALDKLSEYQAKQCWKTVGGINEMQLKSLKIRRITITDAGELKRLLESLKNVDEQAYAYTFPSRVSRFTDFETLNVNLKNGKTIRLRFILSPHEPNRILKPLWELYARVG